MDLSVKDAARGLGEKKWSAVELAEAHLKLAEAEAERTHAYVEVFREEALAEAKASDERRAAGKAVSEFDGIPVAVKDNMCVKGQRVSCGSVILKDYVAPYDGTVTRLLKEAGAVILGRCNMDEFAMGSTTETSVHGPTHNPWDTTRIPGGSSGGSAVAVAEGSALVSLGSDTGGSIRQPAAMCGIVGLKPTYGRVSRYGLVAMASSLDQIGTFGRNVDDVASTLKIISGRDTMDSTSSDVAPFAFGDAERRTDLKGVRIGLPKEAFGKGLDQQVEATFRTAVEKLVALGAEIKEVSLPRIDASLAAYYIIMPSEVSANLARLDGIRYGAREVAESLLDTYEKSRGRGFGKEVRRRIMLGAYSLSSGYYDAYYLKALKVRRLIANDFAAALSGVDALVTPTSPHVAWKMGEKSQDPLSMYLADIYTVGLNIAGLPGVSVPCGLADGLPVGMQIIGRHFDESGILSIAHAFEKAVNFSSLRPARS